MSSPLDLKAMSRAVYALPTRHPAPLDQSLIVVSLADLLKIQTTATTLAGGDTSFDGIFDQALRHVETLLREGGHEEYILVVLAALDSACTGTGKGAGPRLTGKAQGQGRMPGVGWWLWNQGRIPSGLRKGMKRMYIVSPSSYTTTHLTLLLPFVSPKLLPKLYPVSSLLSLHDTYGVSLAGLRLSIPVLMHESALITASIPPRAYSSVTTVSAPNSTLAAWGSSSTAPRGKTWAETFTAMVYTAAAYIPFSQLVHTPHTRYTPLVAEGDGVTESDGKGAAEMGHWRRTAEEMVRILRPSRGRGLEGGGGDVNNVMDELSRVIVRHCTGTEGIFRIAPNSALRPALIAMLDLPLAYQPAIDCDEIAAYDPTLPPKLYLRMFKSLNEPLVPHGLYEVVRQCRSVESLRTLLDALPPPSLILLHRLLHTLASLLPHTPTTRMSSLALAIVVAPDLIRGPDLRQDMCMCLPPRHPSRRSQVLQEAQGGSAEWSGVGGEGGGASLVEVLEMMLDQWDAVEVLFKERLDV